METVLIIGASRGLGLEWVRYYKKRGSRVIVTAREPKASSDLTALLDKDDIILELDVTDERSVAMAMGGLNEAPDITIYNAGVKGYTKFENEISSLLNSRLSDGIRASREAGRELAFQVNTYGFDRIVHTLKNRLLEKPGSTVVYVSSGVADTTENISGGYPHYRQSKTAGEAYARAWDLDLLHKSMPFARPLIFSIIPGLVNTGMGIGVKGAAQPKERVEEMANVIDYVKQTSDTHGVWKYDGTKCTEFAIPHAIRDSTIEIYPEKKEHITKLSANSLYQTIMSSLEEMELQPKLKNFLKHQSLSLMRGIQIHEDTKIKSMLILLNAAALVEIDVAVSNTGLLDQLILEINNNIDSNIDKYNLNISASKSYIEELLIHQIDKIELKNKYNGKPWLLQDKKSISHRVLIGLKKPESNVLGSGLVPTKNDKGWEFPKLETDTFKIQFQNAVSSDEKKRVLILGAGYGTFTYDLLENSKHNNSKFVINDLSSEQMETFKDQLPNEFDGRVTVISGNFLYEVNFPDDHFDQILLQNVMHFFTPEQVDICLNRIYSWLKLGGGLTVTTSSPHWGILKDYVPIFEQRKEAGDEWPGFIPNLKTFLEGQKNPIADIVPNGPIHNFDESTLNLTLLKHNFKLAQSGFFAMPNTFPKPFQGDGKEYVGAVACKPKM